MFFGSDLAPIVLRDLLLKYEKDKLIKLDPSYLKIEFSNYSLNKKSFINDNKYLTEEAVKLISNWFRTNRSEDLGFGIYKIDLIESVFVFQLYETSNGNAILSGYLLEDSFNARMFVSSITEETIIQRCNNLLKII